MVDGDRLVVWSWLPHGSAGSKLDLVTVVFLIFLGECKRALVAHPGSLGVGKASSEYGFHDVHAAGDLSVFSSTIDYVTVLRLFPGLYVDMPWTTPMYAHIYWLSVLESSWALPPISLLLLRPVLGDSGDAEHAVAFSVDLTFVFSLVWCS